jgi:hypothetical protein
LTTQILQAHGCYLGKANRVNILYENVSIRENILKPYLIGVGADPLGQDKLPDTNNLPSVKGLRDRIFQEFELGEAPFAYKDAKLTLVWPIFHHAFPEAKWVLVRRDKDKIVDSCVRALFMRKRNTRKGWERWVEEHEERFERMREELDLIEVWTDSVVSNPQEFARVTDFCKLKFRPDATNAAIKPPVWHRS